MRSSRLLPSVVAIMMCFPALNALAAEPAKQEAKPEAEAKKWDVNHPPGEAKTVNITTIKYVIV